MVATLFTKSFLLLALGLSQHVLAACTQSVTAKQGDTCASIASQAGITVTDFLRSNPSVTSCSQLVVGASYCVKGTPDGAPTSSTAPPQTSTPADLVVSPDGNCGSGVTCAGSRFGDCCSAHGFCGSTTDYCGEGCQAGFGNCGGGTGGPSQSPGGSITVTVTSITSIIQTSFVTQISTSTVTRTSAAATVTQTQTQTTTVTRTSAAATVTQTQTQTTTVTQPRATTTATVTKTIDNGGDVSTITVSVPATITSIVRLTTVVTSVRTSVSVTTSTSITRSTSIVTSVSTRTVNVTSVVIDTITSIATSTKVVTSGVCSPTKTTTGKPTTTTPVQGRPTLPGTPSNCKNYDLIENGDTCRDLADRNKLSLLDFYALNPSVSGTVLNLGFDCTPEFIDLVLSGLCQINCDALWEGYYVCVGR